MERTMSKAGGFFLLLGGLAVAAYVMPSGNDASEPGIGAGADIAKNSPADERPSLDVAAPKPQPAFRSVAPTPTRAAGPVPTLSAPAVVTITPRPSELPASIRPGCSIPRDCDTLGRELQMELRRIGS